MIVAKSMTFDAAHFLPNYEGKCANLHGHTWKVDLAVEGEVDVETGMVVDFKWLTKALETILDAFDHHLINDIIPNPTAENIAQCIKGEFINEWIQGPGGPIQFKWVKIWETEDSYAMVEG